MIQIVKLKEGTVLISQIEPVQRVDYGSPNTKLINPFILPKNERWLSNFTDQTIFMIDDSDILTMAEPSDNILEIYKSITGIIDQIEYDESVEEEEEHY